MAMLAASSRVSSPRRDRAGDRAGLHPVPGDPHVHLGRGADQVLPLAQVEQELVRGRVALPQQLVERGRRRAPAVEHVAGHHLEQVPAGEPLPGVLHHLRIASRPRLGRQILIPNGPGIPSSAGACRFPAEPGRGHPVHLEVVGVPDRLLAFAVQDPDLVRQVQHQVTLGGRAVEPAPHRLELERQVIAERPVQAQVRVVAAERRDDLPQRGEHGRPAAALLLGELPVVLGDDDAVLAGGLDRGSGPAQGGADHRQQHAAAVVQRPDRHPPAGGDDLQARVGVRHVPPAVPSRVLHAGAHHAAAALVGEGRDPAQLGGVEWRGGAGDPHPVAGRHVQTLGVHGGPSGLRPRRRPGNKKAAAVPGRSLLSSCVTKTA